MSENNENCAISVSGLCKSYQIIHSPWRRFQYYVFNRKAGTEFHALHDVSFSVKKGETFGIIGVNGSGKSTLLQLLAGILTPTSGTMTVNGRVSALLELGSGFNPENTGYENIYLNAAILGVEKDKIDEKIDEIVAFADIGDFINEPVKTYSSGMFIRVAFAVAINVDADIIIIDEALAVGDIFFRQKCYAKLNELKTAGKTIILVSHGMNEVEQFCDRALLLHNGEQIMLGRSTEVVAQYYMLNQPQQPKPHAEPGRELPVGKTLQGTEIPHFFGGTWSVQEEVFFDLSQSVEHSNGDAHYLRVGLFDENGKAARAFRQGEYAYFYSEIAIDHDTAVPNNGVVITNQKNIIVHGKGSFQTPDQMPESLLAGDVMYSCIRIKLDIEVGEYTFETGFSAMPADIYKRKAQLPHEDLYQSQLVLAVRRSVGAFAVQPDVDNPYSQLKFYGLVDLQSDFDSVTKERTIP